MLFMSIPHLLPVIAILLSLYIYHLLKKERDTNSLIEHNQELVEKYILRNQKNITALEKELNDYRENISLLKLTHASDFKTIDNKIDDLYQRWSIVSDNRITSIPQNNKEWWEAKQIVVQAPQKVWKPKNLSQSKSGFINENAKHINQVEEIEPNQDFSQLSDEDFENILDDESDDKSTSGSSSSATDHHQEQKPKRKKISKRTM